MTSFSTDSLSEATKGVLVKVSRAGALMLGKQQVLDIALFQEVRYFHSRFRFGNSVRSRQRGRRIHSGNP